MSTNALAKINRTGLIALAFMVTIAAIAAPVPTKAEPATGNALLLWYDKPVGQMPALAEVEATGTLNP